MRTDLYWIDGPWNGRLAIAARPRGGDWLDDEVGSWRQAGLDMMVSLLTPDEVAEFEQQEWVKAFAADLEAAAVKEKA